MAGVAAISAADKRWMAAALGLARRGAGRTGRNPNVGCLLIKSGRVVGRGVTADNGRPHAEAVALAEAGPAAQGATAYVTLEPCAHLSERGPACADLLIGAGVARVVVAMRDPDPRTAGKGIARLQAAGIEVAEDVLAADAQAELAGFVGRFSGRPQLTMKLALSLDGRMVTAAGESQWITGRLARSYVHLLRAQADMVVTGRGTLEVDRPQLTVRLDGYDGPQPARAILGSQAVPEGFLPFRSFEEMDSMATKMGVMRILAEPGPVLAASLLNAGRVDRLALIRAPIIIGAGRGLDGVALSALADAHGRWRCVERRMLGEDQLELYSPADLA